MNQKTPILVYGDSSAAVFLIAQLLKRDEIVVWAKGSGGHLTPAMPFLQSELALGALLDSTQILGDEIQSQPVEKGQFHRVFKNKSFKNPTYKHGIENEVWAPELLCLAIQEYRIRGVTPASIETLLRAHFETHPAITVVESAPVIELEIYERGGEIQFSTGLKTRFNQFYFCDSYRELKFLPKVASVMKHQVGSVKHHERMSALQVVFHHRDVVPFPQDTGFVIPMNRDAGEQFDRDVVGYFLDPKKSVWTVYMNAEEVEDNHEIMKKLRKMKQSLERAFEFSKTIAREQVHFESSYLVTQGQTKLSESNSDFVLVSDSFGLTSALEVLAHAFSIPALEFELTDGAVDPLPTVDLAAHSASL